MNYLDEELLKAKEQIKHHKSDEDILKDIETEKQESIYDEVTHILGVEAHFENRKIEELGIIIRIPLEFYLLDADTKALFFLTGNPPSHVYIGDDIVFQMTFNHTNHSIKNEQMPQFVEISEKIIKNHGARTTILEKRSKQLWDPEEKEHTMYEMHFLSQGIDETVYNIQFYVLVEERILLGSVSFPAKIRDRMVPLAEEIVDSLRVLR